MFAYVSLKQVLHVAMGLVYGCVIRTDPLCSILGGGESHTETTSTNVHYVIHDRTCSYYA